MRRIIVAVIVIIVIAAACIGFVEYQNYNSPSGKCQREAAQGDAEVGIIDVYPNISVRSGTTSGILTVNIDGSACSPITGFTITSIHPLVNGVVNTPFVEYQGILVSATHPEPTGEPASGSIPVSNVTIGQAYSINYTITANDPAWGNRGTITFTAVGY